MKEKILLKIKEKLGQTSLSDRTLDQKAERLAKKYTKEEDLTDSVIDDVIEDLRDLGGQYNHDVAEKARELEQKYKTPPSKDDTGSYKDDQSKPAWFADYEKQQRELIQNLQNELNAEKTQSIVKQKRDELAEALKKDKATNEYILRNVLQQFTPTQDTDIATVKDEFLKKYDMEYSDAFGSGAAPRTTLGGAGITPQEKTANMEAYKKVLQEQGKLPIAEQSKS